jgi:hypothetical protein
VTFKRRSAPLSGVEVKRETIVDVGEDGGFVLLRPGDFILTDARGVDHPVKRNELLLEFVPADAGTAEALERLFSTPLLDPLTPGQTIVLEDVGRGGLRPVRVCDSRVRTPGYLPCPLEPGHAGPCSHAKDPASPWNALPVGTRGAA